MKTINEIYYILYTFSFRLIIKDLLYNCYFKVLCARKSKYRNYSGGSDLFLNGAMLEKIKKAWASLIYFWKIWSTMSKVFVIFFISISLSAPLRNYTWKFKKLYRANAIKNISIWTCGEHLSVEFVCNENRTINNKFQTVINPTHRSSSYRFKLLIQYFIYRQTEQPNTHLFF